MTRTTAASGGCQGFSSILSFLPLLDSVFSFYCTGEALDDEDDDCFWRLQGFIPGELVDALDHELLMRLVRSYVLLPFSGV
jgi:hypothetical protein